MTQYAFGTGQIFATPEGGGNPLRIGALQEASVEISSDVKVLHGQYQYPLDAARGKAKIEGKIGSANIDVAAYNTLFFGGTVATGQKKQAIAEAGTIPASVAYTVTVANGATFYIDLGVRLVTTGEAFKQVPSAPGPMEYTVSAVGLYTFNIAQAGLSVLIDYLWTDAANGGTLSITNNLMGAAPRLQLIFSETHKNKVFTLCLFSNIVDKLSFPLKQDDYLINEMSFQAYANDANLVGFLSTTSKSGGGA